MTQDSNSVKCDFLPIRDLDAMDADALFIGRLDQIHALQHMINQKNNDLMGIRSQGLEALDMQEKKLLKKEAETLQHSLVSYRSLLAELVKLQLQSEKYLATKKYHVPTIAENLQANKTIHIPFYCLDSDCEDIVSACKGLLLQFKQEVEEKGKEELPKKVLRMRRKGVLWMRRKGVLRRILRKYRMSNKIDKHMYYDMFMKVKYNAIKKRHVLMETIQKARAEKAREKTLADQFEAKRAKNKASRKRKNVRREVRSALGPQDKAPAPAAAVTVAQPAQLDA